MEQSEKVKRIADQLTNEFNMMEINQLANLLMETWGVSQIAMAAPAGDSSESSSVTVEEEPTDFVVTLEKVGSNVVMILKTLKDMGMLLKDAKAGTDGVQAGTPFLVSSSMPKDKAEKFKTSLETNEKGESTGTVIVLKPVA